MKGLFRMILLRSILGICIFTILLLGIRMIIQKTIQHNTVIDPSKGIETLEKIKVGEIDQWILIRGQDRTKPVLLWLDGGPGEPLISYARDIGHASGLEKDFVMVYWDQRGTGKSFHGDIPVESMNMDQYVSDIHDISEMLKKKFNVPKIYLLGRSWGTRIGTIAAVRYPELFYAYIAVGLAADSKESDSIGYHFAVNTARILKDHRALKELKEIGPPPYAADEILIQRKWVVKYGGFSKTGIVLRDYVIKSILISPEYSLGDIFNVAAHGYFPIRCLKDEMSSRSLFNEVKKLDIPVYIIEGRHDYMVPSVVAEKFYNQLEAPKGKKLIWFEKAAHTANMDEPQKFYDVVVNVVLKETYMN